jgi:uncharacterized protein YlxW (UPF0749 family)
VSVLDDVNQRQTRLQDEARQLETTQQRLQSGSNSSQAALQAAQARLETLAILAGTRAASGPGIRLIVTDPDGKVDAATLLDTVEELRDAGAEAMQLGTVRVVASTAFVDASSGGGVTVDGTLLRGPYVLLAVGDPQTLSAALDIPGGVLETLKGLGADGTVTGEQQVQVTALHTVSAPRYARPAPTPSG